MKKLIIICIVLCVSMCSLYSQNKTIKGRIITNDLETMPGTRIMINNAIVVGETDLKGFFQIDIPVSEGKILFMAIGMETTIIKLVDKCDEVEVIMMYSGTGDLITKKTDRLRMKKIKHLPKLHKKAFEKGLFKTDKACYTQEFIPIYKKNKSDIKTKSLNVVEFAIRKTEMKLRNPNPA